MNSFGSKSTLSSGGADFEYFSLEQAEKAGAGPVSKLPFSLKVMLENLLRFEDGTTVVRDDIQALIQSIGSECSGQGNRVPASAGADAGLHRSSRRRRSGHNAGCHQANGRRPKEDQPLAAGGSGD